MANVKEVYISGFIPFHAGEDRKLLAEIGVMAFPHFGLKFRFGAEETVPNEFGGMTLFYAFEITGQEAVSYGYVEQLVRLIERVGGTIARAGVRDIEENGGWVEIEVRPRRRRGNEKRSKSKSRRN